MRGVKVGSSRLTKWGVEVCMGGRCECVAVRARTFLVVFRSAGRSSPFNPASCCSCLGHVVSRVMGLLLLSTYHAAACSPLAL